MGRHLEAVERLAEVGRILQSLVVEDSPARLEEVQMLLLLV